MNDDIISQMQREYRLALEEYKKECDRWYVNNEGQIVCLPMSINHKKQYYMHLKNYINLSMELDKRKEQNGST